MYLQTPPRLLQMVGGSKPKICHRYMADGVANKCESMAVIIKNINICTKMLKNLQNMNKELITYIKTSKLEKHVRKQNSLKVYHKFKRENTQMQSIKQSSFKQPNFTHNSQSQIVADPKTAITIADRRITILLFLIYECLNKLKENNRKLSRVRIGDRWRVRIMPRHPSISNLKESEQDNIQ